MQYYPSLFIVLAFRSISTAGTFQPGSTEAACESPQQKLCTLIHGNAALFVCSLHRPVPLPGISPAALRLSARASPGVGSWCSGARDKTRSYHASPTPICHNKKRRETGEVGSHFTLSSLIIAAMVEQKLARSTPTDCENSKDPGANPGLGILYFFFPLPFYFIVCFLIFYFYSNSFFPFCLAVLFRLGVFCISLCMAISRAKVAMPTRELDVS